MRERAADSHEMARPTQEHGAHDDLLAAAERTRRARDTRGEILPEFTGLTAGEALARLMEEETAGPQTPPTADAPPHIALPKPAAARRAAAVNVSPAPSKAAPTIPPPASKSPAKPAAQAEDVEEKPRFEVRV